MGKKLGAALISVALIATWTTGVAATSTNLPSGTALTVDIEAPAVVQAGTPLTISGSATVGETAAVKDTDLVFVIDTSGSTGGSGNTIGCTTILDCEKQAVLSIVDQAKAARSPISNVGLAAFPYVGVQNLVAPESDAIAQYLGTLLAGGGTDYSAGVNRALTILGSSGADEQLIVLLTDGQGSNTQVVPETEAVIMAFSIGGAPCEGPLLDIVGKGGPGSACTTVDDLADLSDLIEETIGSSIDTIEVAVDGTTVYTASPAASSATFSTTANGLTVGSHQICATAHGSDASGVASVEECVGVDVVPPGTVIVDCEGTSTCTATAQDPGKSSLLFTAPPAFDETVTIIPGTAEPGDCGGANCRTSYDVLFPTTSPTGPIASLSVTTTNRVSLADRLKAAVYMDDVRITAQCSNRIIIKIIRDRLGRPEPIPCITITYKPTGQLEYFVKFRADPGFTFR